MTDYMHHLNGNTNPGDRNINRRKMLEERLREIVEFLRVREKVLGLLARNQKIIAENKCNKPKDIGDRVMIWDWSGSQDLESGKIYGVGDEISKYPLILIEKDCKNMYISSRANYKINRDIVVYSPKYKRKIATCMRFVKLLD